MLYLSESDNNSWSNNLLYFHYNVDFYIIAVINSQEYINWSKASFIYAKRMKNKT